MNCQLTIYKGGKVVNSYEYSDELTVLREFTKCMTAKLRGIKTKVRRQPYGNTIKIDHTWPNDEITKDYRYHYVFTDVEERSY